MICILRGHRPITIQGHGDYAGRTVTICQVCGKDLPAQIPNETAGRERLRGYESVAEEFHHER